MVPYCFSTRLAESSTEMPLPRPMVSPVGKEGPRWTYSSPSDVGSFFRGPLRPCLMGTTGRITSRAEPLGITDRDGEGARAYKS